MQKKTSRFSRGTATLVAIALLAFALTLLIEWQRPALVTRLDEGLRDTFLRWSASEQAENRLVVIDINEAALEQIGPWPWPRRQVADLTELLLGPYGARMVGLDIVFADAGDPQGDARMASLAAHAPLTLAQIFDYTPRNPPILQGTLAGGLSALNMQSASQQGSGEQNGLSAYGYIANHAGLAKNARCIGNIGYKPDADGVLRRTPAQTRFEGLNYLNFASALHACVDPLALAPSGNAQGQWRIPYRLALSAYAVISAADILSERAPRTLIAGRYVLVGSSSLSLGDRVSTPLAPLSAGIMVHAASLSGLLDLSEGRARPAWSGRTWILVWSFLSIALAIVCIAKLPAWGSLLVLLGMVPVWLGQAFAGVARQAEWSVTAPLWAYFFLLMVAVPYEWWRTQRKSRRLLTTFSHYVAQPVLDEIVRLDLQHSLKPMLRDVTVLIADMEGYTRATSSLGLEDAATLTKDFLACLTRPVLEGLGTLDKYTGDGLVAFWGAPLPCDDQADRAVSAALDMLAEVDALNARRAQENFPPVRVRIGIESGPALVGDLGTSFRSTYTAVGDCINFASRLEAAAQNLPTQLVIGIKANSQLLRHKTHSLGEITLRGTQHATEVFTTQRGQI
ncbi:Adenylate cyclase 1 [Polaromonas vacuolata]|uniref:Adenylate cyclase 1 n=1 Tax=Polaromonas vacuolata TaxID=37448 RepID=A0A6H2H5Z3_9BURK|nr:adenylate/guanylate cyclase domain-containing protein [Polaromonas vacuolata]QJC55223.1 Adenylate cyclase 1 [Polaromonas vacuolata]